MQLEIGFSYVIHFMLLPYLTSVVLDHLQKICMSTPGVTIADVLYLKEKFSYFCFMWGVRLFHQVTYVLMFSKCASI